ncbi:DinB family protein [Tengunoibacter tsumagoiensis]|uniref:DinB-like domain-containing protein n=1 Tax=Tengunoibacter tsumagoiensis TaxID=2014871 RepID=A0A402A295_9CHLR|nr:DinB family protein [Tengunoibacter tsumagoiensis]GCE13182.1 hypothetical protein KTT_30410 [Tengunoibacter tsumagoiensis]
MLKPTSEQWTIFEQSPGQIAAAVQDLTDKQLRFSPGIDQWSIHDILVHLADSEAVGYWRFRKTLAEADSVLAVYDEAAWEKNLQYEQQDCTLALNLFTLLRAANAALLRIQTSEAWERKSIHAERGELSIYDLFETYYEHGQLHLQQIKRLKRAFPL